MCDLPLAPSAHLRVPQGPQTSRLPTAKLSLEVACAPWICREQLPACAHAQLLHQRRGVYLPLLGFNHPPNYLERSENFHLSQNVGLNHV